MVCFQVAGMYQDPSIGKYKVYYVVTKIIHITSEANQVRSNISASKILLLTGNREIDRNRTFFSYA